MIRPGRNIFFKFGLIAALLSPINRAFADEAADDAQRKAAIADFTRKIKEANYPALFDQAAAEFNVPSDILKGIAFAETRWEHLTWPPGETVSPENGMPRPYGIMSLWDNQYFGHSLADAAKLINKDPEVLKADPLQNIRGAAALLRKLYDENDKPPGTTETDIESWRNAIRKYCGIPEPDLNAQHALNVYVFISQGYHQFGIDWNGRPVNLQPMRQETAQILAAERARRGLPPLAKEQAITYATQMAGNVTLQPSSKTQSVQLITEVPTDKHRSRWWLWYLWGVAALMLLGIIAIFRAEKRRRGPGSPPS